MKKLLFCCTLLVGIVNAFANDIEPITLTVSTPGQLEETLLFCDQSRIEHLILKGTLNGTDLKLINRPTGVLLTVETLDLSGVNCVEDTEVPYATVQDPGNTKIFRFYYSPREEVIRGSDDPNWMVSGTDKFSCFTTSLCGLLSGESIPYKEVIMPHVAYPGDLAATDNKNITKIEYSSATNRIGYGAFYNCSNLSEINIPDKSSISEIGDYAFKYSVYDDFSSIKPTTVGMSAFEESAVTTIDLSSLIVLGDAAFYNSQLTGIINLENLEKIPAMAFQYSRINDVTFSEKLSYIGRDAFSNTPYLRNELNARGYENGVFYLKGFAYQADKASVPTDVVIKEGTVGLCGSLFRDFGLNSITLPSSLRIIGEKSLSYNNFENVILPEGLVAIESDAFCGCYSLNLIEFPESLEYLGNGAFRYCSSLTNLSLGKNIRKIFSDTFEECNGITKIYYNVPDAGEELIPFYNVVRVTVGPDVKVLPQLAYFNDYRDSSSNLMILEYEPRTDDQPLKMYKVGPSKLKSVVLPHTLEGIPDGCFGKTSSLQSVTFTAEPTNSEFYIGSGAFSECVGITSFYIPENTKSIGSGTFYGSGLESVNLPEGIRSIGSGAFSGCLDNQDMLVIPSTLDEFSDPYGGSAFNNIGVKGITVPGNLLGRKDLIISDCPNLENLVLKKGGEILAMDVTCPFKEFDIPDNITCISGFFTSDAVTDVTLPDGLLEISGDLNFKNMSSMSLPVSCLSIPGRIRGDWNYTLKWRIPDNYEFSGNADENIINGLGRVGGELIVPEGVGQFGYNPEDYALPTTEGDIHHVTLPSTLKRINNEAFAGSLFVNFTCHAVTPPIVYGTYYQFISKTYNRSLMGEVLVPEQSVDLYASDPAWGYFDIKPMPDSGIDETDNFDLPGIKAVYTTSGIRLERIPDMQGIYIVILENNRTMKVLVK